MRVTRIVVLRRLPHHITVFQHRHRAELPDAKLFEIEAAAALTEKHRAARVVV